MMRTDNECFLSIALCLCCSVFKMLAKAMTREKTWLLFNLNKLVCLCKLLFFISLAPQQVYTWVCPSGQNKQAIFQQSLSDKVIYHSVTVPGRLECKVCQPRAKASVSEKSANAGNYCCCFFLALSLYVVPKVPVRVLVLLNLLSLSELWLWIEV